jgi:hypothetical protein
MAASDESIELILTYGVVLSKDPGDLKMDNII